MKAKPPRQEKLVQPTFGLLLSGDKFTGYSEGPIPAGSLLKIRIGQDYTVWDYPGTFFMVRPASAPERFSVPLSLYGVDGSEVSFVMEIVGPKTRAIVGSLLAGEKLLIRGPYYSGLQGFLKAPNGPVLAIAKGVAQAALLGLARYCRSRGIKLTALIGGGLHNTLFAVEHLRELEAEVSILPREKDHNRRRIANEINTQIYDLVVSSGSDSQHKMIWKIIRELEEGGYSPGFAWFSNSIMTCAEGICGSCTSGTLKMCKAVLSARRAFA